MKKTIFVLVALCFLMTLASPVFAGKLEKEPPSVHELRKTEKELTEEERIWLRIIDKVENLFDSRDKTLSVKIYGDKIEFVKNTPREGNNSQYKVFSFQIETEKIFYNQKVYILIWETGDDSVWKKFFHEKSRVSKKISSFGYKVRIFSLSESVDKILD